MSSLRPRNTYQFSPRRWGGLVHSPRRISMLIEQVGQLGNSHGIRGIAFDVKDGLTVTTTGELSPEQLGTLEALIDLCAETLPYAERQVNEDELRARMVASLAQALDAVRQPRLEPQATAPRPNPDYRSSPYYDKRPF
jgi:hypothetical protein